MTTIALDELELLDDLDIDTADAESYKDATGPAPIPDGTYTFKLTSAELDKDADGNIRNTKHPAVVISAEVVQAKDERYIGRKVSFIRVYSTPFQREGVTVSGLGDLLRSIDATANHSGAQKILAIKRYAEGGATFRARTQWEAQDYAWFRDQGGNDLPKGSEGQKHLRKASTLKGMKNFPQDANGNPKHEWVGPSGEVIEARVTLNYIPGGGR